jgi:hypothetical protein
MAEGLTNKHNAKDVTKIGGFNNHHRLPQVRNAAVGALDAWVAAVPAEKVLPSVVDFLPSAKASNEGKVTGLRWIMGLVEAGKTQRCLDSALKAAAVASGDKAVEVREAASHLAAALVKVGNATLRHRWSGLIPKCYFIISSKLKI